MKKILFCVFIFLVSINIFAKTNVKRQVEKIREEFVKINSEKNYKVENIVGPGESMTKVYYRKNGELKKVVYFINIPESNTVEQYYLKDDKVFFAYREKKFYQVKEPGVFDSTKIFRKEETRFYFDSNGDLIRIIDNGEIFDKDNITEEYENIADDLRKTTFELEKSW